MRQTGNCNLKKRASPYAKIAGKPGNEANADLQDTNIQDKKYFLKNVKDVGITMPKSIQARCRHGSMQ